ncbi:hypothetical protein SAMN05421841_2508 [Chryseobacterium wanjuense]|jgi:hypothetical protein|uniref:Microcystin-dependent protein n=1 Tax=Chryseobacterium wanjuense TaxID=356305 RepID=A0A1I0RDW9_9FLAO|nr:hypothetical protein [Chryseobacterium wanjuense]SEW38795.1 hypothetical protein SAMN05421841_2508 [Chryseobacterium wanjuense]
MKKIFIITTSVISTWAFSQIGVNTPTPAATFDVVAKKNDGTTSEGIIAPRLSGNQIKSADARYTAPQTGALVYATNAVSAPTAKTIKITAPGYYYFDGSIWQKMGDERAFTGDIKHSARTADHGGWYLLNGRAISTLPVEARTAAAALGFTGNIPNATDRVLKTKTAAEAMGATGGISTITIKRVNLPDVNLIGTLTGAMDLAGVHAHRTQGNSGSGGQHNHSLSGSTNNVAGHRHGPNESLVSNNGNSEVFIYGNTHTGNNGNGNYASTGHLGQPRAWNGIGAATSTGLAGSHNHSITGTAAAAGNHNHAINIVSTESGNHRHSMDNVRASVPTGGSGEELDNRSPYLSVNTFIYLGE